MDRTNHATRLSAAAWTADCEDAGSKGERTDAVDSTSLPSLLLKRAATSGDGVECLEGLLVERDRSLSGSLPRGAAASLLVDYILTVAVSVSAGVAALVSLEPSTISKASGSPSACSSSSLLTAGNLRGLEESGKIFAAPTYVYVVMLTAMVVYGLARAFFGDIAPVPLDAARPRT